MKWEFSIGTKAGLKPAATKGSGSFTVSGGIARVAHAAGEAGGMLKAMRFNEGGLKRAVAA